MRTVAFLFILVAALGAPADETKKVDPVRIPAIVDLNNTKCPISGEDIESDSHIDWNGVRTHLCCDDCKEAFEKDPAAALAKLNLKVAKDAEGKTVVDLANTTCPVMGKPAKPDSTADFGGVRMHFCCGKCPKHVEKDPTKACEKLGYTYIPAVIDLRNATCPMSGEPVGDDVADADGIRVHFCCGDCVEAFEKDPPAMFLKLGVDPKKLKETTK